MVRAGLSVRTFGRGGRPGFRPGLSVGEPSAPPWFRPGSAGLSAQTPVGVCGRNLGRRPGFQAEIPVVDLGFKPKLRCGATETPAPRRRLCGAAAAGDERSCGRDGPVTYRSSTERVCPRVVPKGRADRDRNGQTPHARAPAGADVMPVGRVSAAPIARSLCRSGVRTTLRARGRLQAVAAGA